MRIYTLFICLLLSAMPLFSKAQLKYYQYDNSVKVTAYGQVQKNPWCGGFNNPQFASADLNRDGLIDLIVFEPSQDVRTFINVGTAGNADYRYAPSYEVNFPPVSSYMILADYNCDGIPDLFMQHANDGFSVYKGYYNGQNELCFTYYMDLFYGDTNAYNNPGDIPAIVDVDGDGDLDFIAYNIVGGSMNLYKNMRVENGLSCDTLVVEYWDACWGRVLQTYPRTHELAYTCTEPHHRGGAEPIDTAARITHQGNTPCLFDWDMDGDYDYLDGNVLYNEMTFLKNGKIETGSTVDTMIYQDTTWQTSGTPIELPTWPAAFNIDVDQDGKKDLLISPNLHGTENYNCIWYYKNYSTPGVPDWRFQSDSFFVDQSIDVGTAAYPMLFDYDKDGLPDLFVGSAGYFQPDGSFRSRLSYYHNTSTPGNPSFTLQTKDFLNIDTLGFEGSAIAFGDIDNDGKSDMVMGHEDGTLSYFKNMAASEGVTPDWQLVQRVLTDSSGDTIYVYDAAAPCIYDLDKDGKPDLLIGSIQGTLQYYRNVSTTPGVISLQLENTDIGGVRADPRRSWSAYSAPFIGKIDSTDTDYLMMGSGSGAISRFTGFQGGDTSIAYTLVDAQYSYIDTMYNLYAHNGGQYGTYDNERSTLTAGHISGDSSYYMIVGNQKGGLEMYKWQIRETTNTNNFANENGKILVYPNPASEILNINWNGILQPQVLVSFINMTGQTYYSASLPAGSGHAVLSTATLPSGMYVCVLQSGINRYYSKFTVVR